MILKRSINLLLLSILLISTAESQSIKDLKQWEEIGSETYRTGINLSFGSQQCEPMTFSLPKPETGCCGLHKHDETNCKFLSYTAYICTCSLSLSIRHIPTMLLV